MKHPGDSGKPTLHSYWSSFKQELRSSELALSILVFVQQLKLGVWWWSCILLLPWNDLLCWCGLIFLGIVLKSLVWCCCQYGGEQYTQLWEMTYRSFFPVVALNMAWSIHRTKEPLPTGPNTWIIAPVIISITILVFLIDSITDITVYHPWEQWLVPNGPMRAPVKTVAVRNARWFFFDSFDFVQHFHHRFYLKYMRSWKPNDDKQWPKRAPADAAAEESSKERAVILL